MIKKEGKYPCNARVDVDYSNGKPNIKFAYPGKNPKKDAIRQAGNPTILLLIWILIGVLPLIIFAYPAQEDCPKECNNFSIENLKEEIRFNITCDDKIYELRFADGIFTSHKTDWGNMIFAFWLYLAILPSFFINRFITKQLIKKKWYTKWFPKSQAEGIIFKTKMKNYLKFKPKDVLGNVIIIPSFSNVELDYKTKGDFSKQLKSIKIREYRKKRINMKTKKVSKEKINKFKWYAIFSFKEIPKDGYLEVIFQ